MMSPKEHGNSERFTGEPRETETIGDKLAYSITRTGKALSELATEYRESVEASASYLDSDGGSEIKYGDTKVSNDEVTEPVVADD